VAFNTQQREGENKMIPSFTTAEGRLALYNTWIKRGIAQGSIELGKDYKPAERKVLFADWMRALIKDGTIDPHKRLPSYEALAALPFNLTTYTIALVIRELRAEGVLPQRKRRKDARWTERDLDALRYIGEMHAMRFDQLRRLLTQLSPTPIEGELLSPARAWKIMRRWEQAKLACYQHVYHAQPGWVSLTGKGLRLVDLHFQGKRPSDRSYEHLYWINEVRMGLKQREPQMTWISERTIQAQQQWRTDGQRLTHIPDGKLVLSSAQGEEISIDIEVQVSKPSPREVSATIGGDIFSSRRQSRSLQGKQKSRLWMFRLWNDI
jgi:DNA-binding transcriptional regulator YhcF (GntR family)